MDLADQAELYKTLDLMHEALSQYGPKMIEVIMDLTGIDSRGKIDPDHRTEVHRVAYRWLRARGAWDIVEPLPTPRRKK